MAMIASAECVFVTTSDLIILPRNGILSLSTMIALVDGSTLDGRIQAPAAVFHTTRTSLAMRDVHRWLGLIEITFGFKWPDGEFKRFRHMVDSAPKTACVLPLPDVLQQLLDSMVTVIY